MKTTLTLSDVTRAVSMAVEAFLRRQRLERLRALRGKVDSLSNDDIETSELGEL